MNTPTTKTPTPEPSADAGPNCAESLGSRPAKPVAAQWDIHLHADCPHCKEWVDLLDYADFWDGRDLEIAEHGTERSRAVEVVCPECGHDFEVDCEY